GQPIALLLTGAFIGGIGTGLTSVGSNYLRQKESPIDAVGRVMGIFNSLQSVVCIIAPLIGGVMVTTIGVSYAFQVIGCAVGVLGVVGILWRNQFWGKPARSAKIGAESVTKSVEAG
ncbi:MFS transporter, partial [Frankia sp. Cpl3]|nr:MFS transporter [Frankia sp. Cpl3]